MVRTVRQRLPRVELAVRCAQPAFGHARHRFAALADFAHVLAVGADVANRREYVHVFGRARDPQVEHERSGHFGIRGHGRRLERYARARIVHRPVVAGAGGIGGFGGDLRRRRHEFPLAVAGLVRRFAIDLKIQLRPLRARERPLVLETVRVGLSAAARPNLDLNRRLAHDAGVDAFQPVIEPAQLVDARFFRMERMKMRAAVYAQLLVRGCRAHVALGVASQVHGETAPVADAVHRHRDPVPVRADRAPIAGIEIVAHVIPQKIVVERIGIDAARPAEQVMRRLVVVPGGDETHRENAAVISLVAVLIRASFPRHDRFQRGRIEPGNFPLERRVIRNAECADAARAPRLARDPLDAVVGVERFLVRAGLRLARRLAGTPRVDTQQRIATRAPP